MSDFAEMVEDLITYQAGGKATGQKIEATAHMHHYARNGYWRVEAVGFADTKDEAGAAAKLLLGQASAAIRVAVSTSVHRVPETNTKENAHERTGHRPQRAD